jgi:hypothetical protein
MKKVTRKMNLNHETLRALTPQQAQGVVGGCMTAPGRSSICGPSTASFSDAELFCPEP